MEGEGGEDRKINRSGGKWRWFYKFSCDAVSGIKERRGSRGQRGKGNLGYFGEGCLFFVISRLSPELNLYYLYLRCGLFVGKNLK